MGWWSTDIMGGDTPWDIAGSAASKLRKKGARGRWLSRMHMPDGWTEAEQQKIAKFLNAYPVETLAQDKTKERSILIWSLKCLMKTPHELRKWKMDTIKWSSFKP